jgi:signal transduction histidine kinase
VALRLRIRHKLMLGLGLVVAVMSLLLGGTLKGLLSFRASMKTIESKTEETMKAANVWDHVKALAIPPRTTEAHESEFCERLTKAKQALDAYQAVLQDTIDRGRDRDNGYLERIKVQALQQQFAKLEAAVQATKIPEVGFVEPLKKDPLDDPNVKKEIDPLIVTATDLLDDIYASIRGRARTALQDFKISLIIVLSTCGVGILLLTWLLRFFYGWVFSPVRDLQEGAGRVARGDFEHLIEVRSGDEMEDLAAAFNDMTGRLREMYRDMAHQINERSRQLVRSERLVGVGFLAAGVAHEINNPLASIAFCSEALEQRLAGVLEPETGPGPGRPTLAQRLERPAVSTEDSETISKYLKMIQQEAFRCKEITQRLLEFSRGGERRREPTDLGEVVQGVLDVVQHLQSCKGKHLLFEPAERLVAWVNAQEVKSVFLNLVVNALDSMDEAGTLTITQRQRDGMAELVFSDTGCGMTAEVLENIFEPFFTRSRTGKGTGLGLSISHRIVSQHGGEIEASSAGPGRGSTFTVRLPLQPAAEPKTETQGQRPEEADPELYFQDQRPGRRQAA